MPSGARPHFLCRLSTKPNEALNLLSRDNFDIVEGLMTTVHAKAATQLCLDGPFQGRDA